MTHDFIYVETDDDREAPLREFIYDGYVHARGQAESGVPAYVLWSRQAADTLIAVRRNPWVTYVRLVSMTGGGWPEASAHLTTEFGWSEDATYRGPPPTPWEREAVELLAHSSVKVIRARWQGYWVMLMVSHTEADENNNIGIIPLAMIVDPALAEAHLRLTSPDGTDTGWESYKGETVIFPEDEGEDE